MNVQGAHFVHPSLAQIQLAKRLYKGGTQQHCCRGELGSTLKYNTECCYYVYMEVLA